MMKQYAMVALAAALLSVAAQAGEPVIAVTPPDPAKLTMPPLPLAYTDKDLRSADSRYYYHKDGASYLSAFAEMTLCTQDSHTVTLVARPPDFAPAGSAIPARDQRGTVIANAWATYGLVGGLLGAYVEGEMQEGEMRLCMSYRGYKRYAVSREAYRELTRGSDADTMARQALAASGPTPLGGEVGP
jgi:hypothetical protein